MKLEAITLRNGITVPPLGLGTWELRGDECRKNVELAIELGYRHIDTAFGYENHGAVAEGIGKAGVARSELFITTKIPMERLSRSEVLDHGKRLQDELRTNYVDLLLIHWPSRHVPLAETLGALGELVERGVTRSVGVSNFTMELVRKAEAVSPMPLVTNQVEFHPLLNQRKLLELCASLGIRVTAYSPIARGAVVRHEGLRSIGEAHGASAVQVTIAWLLAKGIITIPKASGRAHLQANLDAALVELSSDEIARIDGFNENRRLVDGSWVHYKFDPAE